MRQSLSDREAGVRPARLGKRNRHGATGTVVLAALLSVVLAAVAIVDQSGARALASHTTELYAPYGVQSDPNLLYGLVYTVAACGSVLWLLVLWATHSGNRFAPTLAMVVSVIAAALAVLLLVATEYGERLFPAWWGLLALLPALAGIAAAALLRRRPTATRRSAF